MGESHQIPQWKQHFKLSNKFHAWLGQMAGSGSMDGEVTGSGWAGTSASRITGIKPAGQEKDFCERMESW